MTALKPIENRRVTGVPSERYPLNGLCAHPECAETATDPHHCFPRSQIGNDSWFVAVELKHVRGILHDDGSVTTSETEEVAGITGPIPHVTGLCRAHHDAVEAHDAWIKLEGGVFVWFERLDGEEWELLAPLDPQPCSGEKRKKPVKRFTGEARRQRRTISIKVPDDTEDGGALWDEAIESIKARLITEGLYDEGDKIPIYEALMAALNDWLAIPPHAIDPS